MLRLLEEDYAVTGVDNFSRGNRGAIQVLENLAKPAQFLFIEMDLGVETDVRLSHFEGVKQTLAPNRLLPPVHLCLNPALPQGRRALCKRTIRRCPPLCSGCICGRVGSRAPALLQEHYCKHPLNPGSCGATSGASLCLLKHLCSVGRTLHFRRVRRALPRYATTS